MYKILAVTWLALAIENYIVYGDVREATLRVLIAITMVVLDRKSN